MDKNLIFSMMKHKLWLFYLQYIKNLNAEEKVKFDKFAGAKGPQYAYGVFWAAKQAKALGLSRISVIEFGVATGRGLLALEQVAKNIGEYFGLTIDAIGFDMKDLPAPEGYKDMPYVWQEGFYKMDEEKLRKKLSGADLIIGDVKNTVGDFIKDKNRAPIGFVSIDVDYYSSTKSALEIFKSADETKYLPRVYMYFDDVISKDETLYCDFVGELLAIKEFNGAEDNRKRQICKIDGLSLRRVRPALWNEKMYALHFFTHPQYNEYVLSKPDRQYQDNQL